MSIIDIILLILLIYAMYNGYRKGFIGQLTKLAALLLGIWGAIHFSHLTSSLIQQYFSETTKFLPLIAFGITFLVVVMGVHFIGVLVEGFAKMVMLGLPNKILGALFGMLKAALIISVILALFDTINEKSHILSDETQEKSILYKPIKSIAPSIYPYLKFEEIKSFFEASFGKDGNSDT